MNRLLTLGSDYEDFRNEKSSDAYVSASGSEYENSRKRARPKHVKKKQKQSLDFNYDTVRFSTRGTAVKYNMDYGSLSEAEDEPKKKKEVVVTLEYDAAAEGYVIEGIFDHSKNIGKKY